MTKLIQCGLSVSPPQYERIKRLAHRHGRRQSECIRMMIDFSLPLFELGQKVDFARLITMLEFNTLALDTLVQHGHVRYVGVSNWAAWQIVKALGIAERLGCARFEN